MVSKHERVFMVRVQFSIKIKNLKIMSKNDEANF